MLTYPQANTQGGYIMAKNKIQFQQGFSLPELFFFRNTAPNNNAAKLSFNGGGHRAFDVQSVVITISTVS
jgi:hypothetical protein